MLIFFSYFLSSFFSTDPFLVSISKMSSDIKSKDQVFYLPISERLPTQAFRDLLINYSHIPKFAINKHLEEVASRLSS